MCDESQNPSEGFSRLLKNAKKLLINDKIDYIEISENKLIAWDRSVFLSKKTNTMNEIEEGKINIFQQFYINNVKERYEEIKKSLLYNCNNNNIDKIYLLNERIYSSSELGVDSDKIIQIVINKRMTYYDIIDYVNKNNINGYIVISNSDIFFDKTILNIKKCNVIKDKKVYCLNRFDFNNHNNNLLSLKLDLEGRPDCQDVWIYHSSYNNILNYKNIFDIELGTPGCDNKVLYLFKILGMNCYNEPELIRTYHYHRVQTRNYDFNTKRPPYPYYGIYPVLKSDYNHKDNKFNKFDFVDENLKIKNYIDFTINNNKNFIIPLISIPYSNLAFAGVLLNNNPSIINYEKIKNDLTFLKNKFFNLNNEEEIKRYSRIYLESFNICDTYCLWEPWSYNYTETNNSHYFIQKNFIKKDYLWANALNTYLNIKFNPWTLSLKNKKILIISEHNKLIEKIIDNRKNIYGIDIFPSCNFIFIDIIKNENVNFVDILKKYFTEIESKKDFFDIAFLSVEGLSNLFLPFLLEIKKSGIVLDNILYKMFGIYDEKFEKENIDIINIYKNEFWQKI